jgi:hypothetical protein
MYISLWPTLFIRLVMTFIANLYTLLSGDPGNLAGLGTLQGSFPSQLARKILTLAFSCACPVYTARNSAAQRPRVEEPKMVKATPYVS